jgi:beta-galactosidase
MKKIIFPVVAMVAISAAAERSNTELKQWDFSRDSLAWESVTIPHDWAIYGPFDRKYDLQKVAVEQNGETEETWKTGRTGGLPYLGKGYYRTTFEYSDTTAKSPVLLFDGAMSHARVKVNGVEVAYWPYGYNSFSADLKGVVKPGTNTVEVSLENLPQSSRWYPGAGLYRNVHLIDRERVHIPVWGTYLTTPYVSREYATVHLVTDIEGANRGEQVQLTTDIYNAVGDLVTTDTHNYKIYPGQKLTQNLRVNDPALWSPDTPTLYNAVTKVTVDGKVMDEYTTRFGIRTVEVRAGEGFFLNGEKLKFKGVCNHHDLGPLGAAVNKAALRHQLEMLKDMGANAVRTSHNMPAPELVSLCDELGLMMMVEPFDDWSFRPKSPNGYGAIFSEWAERDMLNMIHHYRNNPAVVLWSIGNEVPSQWGEDGVAELSFLQNICHREDPTRPVTCGMDQFDAVVNNGFAAALDVPGFNYKVNRYEEALPKLPQNIILGSETASTVSSRGKYYFPVELGSNVMRDVIFRTMTLPWMMTSTTIWVSSCGPGLITLANRPLTTLTHGPLTAAISE